MKVNKKSWKEKKANMNWEYDKKAEILLEQMEWAEAVCVGAAAGMSVATGYDMAYHSD